MCKSPSVCFLMPGPDEGPVGGFKVAYEYANRLARAGYDVTVAYAIFPWIENFWRNLLRHPRSRLLELLRIIRTGFSHAYRAPEWFALDRSVKRIYPLYFWRGLPRRLPKGTKFIATYYWTAICLQAMRISAADKFYFIQGKEAWYVEDEQTLLRTYHYPMRKIVISNWLCDELRKVGEDAVVIPNGLDFEYFKRCKPIEARSAKEIAMLWHASKRKRTDDAVKALEIVHQKHSNIHVTAFGTGPCPSGLTDWFTYVQRPDRERHNAIYNNAAIFLATSEQEGWGLTPCEAMMCGAAVVCTDIGGYREFAQDGVNALMSAVGDADSLAENVCRLIEDDGLRMRLATAGYDKIKQFTWERAVASFRRVLTGDVIITKEGNCNED